jgi:prevent-host-death family protein
LHLPREYRQVLTSNDKGNIAEAAIALEAIKLGIDVLRPIAEHGRYDLAFDLGNQIVRVQCKWATLAKDTVRVYLASTRYTSRGEQIRTRYTSEEIDYVAAYCQKLESCYLLPAELFAGRSAVHLRLSRPRNKQRAAINWAQRYLLSGAVAQLGERRHGMAEVRGSSPLSSTTEVDGDSSEITVGAHQFRNHFGYWMERAAAGDDILITRRGRRYARLGPADPQLATTGTAPAEAPATAPAAPPPGTAGTSR